MKLPEKDLCPKNKVGLKTLSLELNLSMTAVSKALKDSHDISEDTKRIVRKKALELGYVPLEVAQSKAKGASMTIGILVDTLKSPFFGMAIELFIYKLAKKGYKTLIFPNVKQRVGKDLIKETLKNRVDGIVSFIELDSDAYEAALLCETPILLFGRYSDFPRMSVVYSDDFQGGNLAAQYLVEQKNAPRLCYVGVNEFECSKRREDGFFDSAKKMGINDVLYVESSDLKEKIDQIIKDEYHWIFCFDDQLAEYLLNLCDGNNLSIVGYNGTSKFYDFYHDIPSISAEYEEMVNASIDMLLREIGLAREGIAEVKKFSVSLTLPRKETK